MTRKKTSVHRRPRKQVYAGIICCSLLLGIALGLITSHFIYHNEQVKNAHVSLERFSSLLDEKSFFNIVDAVNKLAAHPLLKATVTGKEQPDNPNALLILNNAKYICGISLVYLMNAAGDVVSCTPYADGTKTLTGKNYSFRPYFINPKQTGKVFSYPALGVTTGKRGIYFSAPIYQNGKVVGVVVMKTDLKFIDQELADYPYPCALLTEDGVVFSSNQEEWLFKTAFSLSDAKKKALRATKQFADKPLSALPFDLHTAKGEFFFEGQQVVPVVIPCNFLNFSYVSLFPLTPPSLGFTIQFIVVSTLAVLLFLFTGFALIDRRRLFSFLKAREKDYQSIINNLSAAFYRVDNNSKFIRVSPTMAELYQPSDCSFPGMIGCDESALWIYSKERQNYLRTLDENGGVIRDFSCQFRKSDGSIAHVVINAAYFFDENGVRQGIEGLVYDVTYVMQLQKQLILLKSAVQVASNSIVITDIEGVILWINYAFTAMTGYDEDEAVGQKMSILKSGYHDDSFYSDMWKKIISGKTWKGELINRRKDGSIYYEEMSITPVFDEDRNIISFIAIKNDISDRKKQEEEHVQMNIPGLMHSDYPVEEENHQSERKKMKNNESDIDLSGTEIALITDNNFERLLITELLTRKNASIHCVQDATDVSRNMQGYMLVLLDMPLSSALPIMEEMKRSGGADAVKAPVLLITSENFDVDSHEVAGVGIDDYIQKPIDPVEFFSKIMQCLDIVKNVSQIGKAVSSEKTEMVLDRATGIKRVMGNEGMYKKMLKKFHAEFHDFLDEVFVEFEKKNFDLVKRMIHTLKGASGGIGADALQKECEKIEEMLDDQIEQEAMMRGFDDLAAHLSDLMKELSAEEDNCLPKAGKPQGNKEVICSLYDQFFSALQSGKLKQSKQLEVELDRYDWIHSEFPDIANLLKLLDDYAFDQAATLFSYIRSALEK